MTADAVCFNTDGFIDELECDRGQALWRAELSNGLTVIQDDGRPGLVPPQAWLRLHPYLEKHNLKIVKLWIQFRGRSQTEHLPAHAEGYYFGRSAMRAMTGGETTNFYLVGHLHGDIVTVQKWLVPELILMEVSDRPISACFRECLIVNGIKDGKDILV